jgi:hypothetical protein
MKKLVLGILLCCGMPGVGNAALVDVGNGTVYDSDTSLYWFQDMSYTADQTYSQIMTKITGLNTNLTSSDWGTWHLASLDEMKGLYQSSTHPNATRTQEICETFTPIVMEPIYGGGSSWRGIYNYVPFGYTDRHFWSGIFIQDGVTTYTDLNIGNTGFYLLDNATRIASGGWIAASGYNPPAPPVPVPGAIWLLGSGLAALAGMRRKMKK